jgi:type IV pilus assembly protein PilB
VKNLLGIRYRAEGTEGGAPWTNGSEGHDEDPAPGSVQTLQVGEPDSDQEFIKVIPDRVTRHLYERGAVTRKQIRESRIEWQREGERTTLWRTLAKHPDVDRDSVFSEAALVYAFRRSELPDGKPDRTFVKTVIKGLSGEQQDQLYVMRLLPLEYAVDSERGTSKLVFATHDPARPEIVKVLRQMEFEDFDIVYAPESQVVDCITAVFPPRNKFLERLAEDGQAFDLGPTFESGRTELVDQQALEEEINRSSLINLFEASLVEAVRQGASDVHVFPYSQATEFFFRVDGELRHWHTQDKVHPEAMLAVVKDRCLNVDRFEREAAQDGYIQRHVDDTLIRYRVSVLPLAGADHEVKSESIVIRVLDDRKVFNDLGQIGLLQGALDRFRWAVRQPHGMVIMTGPTGSGKSTTLVAALHAVIREEVNILTVEDPVEYMINGVRQIKLGPRLGLENALRSILRHDPDIVMVGEMRDRITAELAIKLANTGHLTFTTLHTNDAPSAISRLYKMGIEPFLIAYAINLIVAQRLVRTLCNSCKRPDPNPDPVLLQALGFSGAEIV